MRTDCFIGSNIYFRFVPFIELRSDIRELNYCSETVSGLRIYCPILLSRKNYLFFNHGKYAICIENSFHVACCILSTLVFEFFYYNIDISLEADYIKYFFNPTEQIDILLIAR